jgi:chondroitin AC lyase
MFIRGIQWFSFKQWYDQNMAGRKIGTHECRIPIGSLKRLINLNTPRQNELKNMLTWMQDNNTSNKALSGNKMFWLHDLMVHRRNNYYISFRMTSERTVSNEGGLGQGLNNKFTGTGVTYMVRTGKEYNDSVFKRWSWSRLPGITASPTASTTTKTWGNGSWNNHKFAGGVSDGQNGAAGFVHNRTGVRANKSCFFFDKFMVALGTGINSKADNLVTTLNQSDLLQQPVYIGSGGKVFSMAEFTRANNNAPVNWVYHNRIGYFFPEAYKKKQLWLSTNKNLFYLGLKHGKVKNADYTYAVIPDCSLDTMKTVQNNRMFRISANNQRVQAVESADRNIGQAIIFAAGTQVDLCGFKIQPDKPCAVMLKKNKDKTLTLSASNPQCNSSDYPVLKLTFNKKLNGKGALQQNGKTVIALPMSRGLNAGKTVSLILKQQ